MTLFTPRLCRVMPCAMPRFAALGGEKRKERNGANCEQHRQPTTMTTPKGSLNERLFGVVIALARRKHCVGISAVMPIGSVPVSCRCAK